MTSYTTQVKYVSDQRNLQIIDQFEILDVDQNWQILYNRLKHTRKKTYNPNEKYIIHHYDTEFFLHNKGLFTENFKKIVSSLDIDPCRFIVFTNHRDSDYNWNYDTTDQNCYEVIETPFTDLLKTNTEILPIPKVAECNMHFCSVMGVSRCHRDKLSYFLLENNLVDKNYILYHKSDNSIVVNKNLDNKKHKNISKSQSQCDVSTLPPDCVTVVPQPFTRINQDWAQKSRLKSVTESVYSKKIIKSEKLQNYFDAPWYSKIFVDIVAETVFDYPHSFISEKTIKPIVMGRPFILVGASSTLTWLHELGFKTFNKWWHEDYDSIRDPHIRLQKVFQLVHEISNWSIDKCNSTLIDMHSVLEHNKQNYDKIWKNLI